MKLQDLKDKALQLNEAFKGIANKQHTFSIYLEDKEVFKALHHEVDYIKETKLFSPSGVIGEYYFIVDLLGFKFIINYKAKSVTTYETL